MPCYRGNLGYGAIRQREASDGSSAQIMEVQVLQRSLFERLVPACPETIFCPRSAKRVDQNRDRRALLVERSMPDSEPKSPPRTPPYIYSRDELRRLFDPTSVEISRRGAVQLDAATFRTLLLLLYGAGLRFSEATGLTLADVDLAEDVLTIRATKFFKSRLVPIGPQLATARHARPSRSKAATSRRATRLTLA
jgi:integrase